MTDPMVALVTGSNKGIGREIAGQLAALGHTVVIAARSAELGERAATEICETGGDAVAVVLDVTDKASVAAAADAVEVRFGHIDALINNAAVGRRPGADIAGQQPRSANVDDIRFVFETNIFGVITVTNAFLPLLRRSAAPRIVNVSSSVGSFAWMSAPAATAAFQTPIGYVTSKTVLTALTLQYANGLADEHILVNAVCPGLVATDLTHHHAGGRTPAEGAVAAVRMATIAADGPTGTFTDDNGPVAW